MEIPETACRAEFKELANIIMEEDGLQYLVTPDEGLVQVQPCFDTKAIEIESFFVEQMLPCLEFDAYAQKILLSVFSIFFWLYW